jgi:hypothetical protein
MNRLILAAALAAGCTLASASPASAAARNYDCSKPGNANKAACKTGAKDAIKGSTKPAPAAKTAAATKPAPAAKPATKVAAATTTKTVTRNYDCTKKGNANKAQCKGSTTVATSTTTKTAAAAPPAKPTMLQRMKNAMSGSSTPKPTPAAAPAKATPAKSAASVEDRNPAGAIAQCKDGTYSHSKQRTGACSRHGGVAKWS